jgi:hypothetical protein
MRSDNSVLWDEAKALCGAYLIAGLSDGRPGRASYFAWENTLRDAERH